MSDESRAELVSLVERTSRNVHFQTGGEYGLRWQIVWAWAYKDFSDRTMFVGREMQEYESLKRPPSDMYYELRRCKAEAVADAVLQWMKDRGGDGRLDLPKSEPRFLTCPSG